MPIEVKVFATLIDLVGKRRLYVEKADTVKELLDVLDEQYPGFKKQLEGGYTILVNGLNIEHLNGFETSLKDGDVVSIFPPAGGG
ncbi:MoaD/ThiS family protein [Thermosphaera chiliense]|uniref:MoaD/ThiS family protein n=1 Tax=Thermosphaera chiliense TaxID=3402707 RepID=A0A7M1URX2_9CREN|nr:MoaD family protein [Thermosphaera aggregans]QOR95028.1 MoaD/ThiS family protein [Thermosphaera aggregans]